jgi:20S proteasome subunit beta 1
MVRYYLAAHTIELGREPLVKNAANIFKTMCYQNKDRLLAGIICGGWDRVEGGAVYSISIGGSCVKQDYAIGGSGSTYVYGYCDAHYRKNMSRDECIDFVKHAVAHAMARDGSSGGVIRLAIIDKDGVERQFVAGNELPFNLE